MHRRNTEGMRAAPRCGAKTRKGTPCKSPCVRDRKRCRMHGGSRGSGARPGNTNALKHGFYSRAEKQRIRRLRAFIREAEATLEAAGVQGPRPALPSGAGRPPMTERDGGATVLLRRAQDDGQAVTKTPGVVLSSSKGDLARSRSGGRLRLAGTVHGVESRIKIFPPSPKTGRRAGNDYRPTIPSNAAALIEPARRRADAPLHTPRTALHC